MHATSLENMQLCFDRYVEGAWREARDALTVVDLGGADVNGSYRDVLGGPGVTYLGADLAAAPGVALVMDDPYRIPLPDASADIVVSGQMLEHCEFFWLSFAEMVRVLKPGGYLFLIAPSAGPIHRYPVDCYRFYPDAYRALAKHAGCHLVDVWMDERGPWQDLVGVFAHEPQPARRHAAPRRRHPSMRFEPPAAAPDAPEEACRGERPYREVLATLHAELAPRRYLEIGVRRGASLRLAGCPSIGVDPDAEVEDLPEGAQVFATTSDDFFRGPADTALDAPPELAFIDGMHLFEYALRDFMNIERRARPGTLVVIDDILPNHPAQAERERRTRVWTGDVWKLHRCLADLRPDLQLLVLDTHPSGLLLIAGLDPKNRVLWQQYNPLVRRYRELAEVPEEALQRTSARSPADPAVVSLCRALSTLNREGANQARVAQALRDWRRGAGVA